MFSDYSWWDFIKVALCLIVPYYLFVAWKYYREDIQDWLWNRGKKEGSPVAVATETPTENADELTKGLFAVQTYEPLPTTTGAGGSAPAVAPVPTPDPAVPSTPVPAQTTPPAGQTTPAVPQTTPAVADRPVITSEPVVTTADEEEEESEGLLTDGPAVEQAPVVIPFEGTLLVPTESSLRELINTGQRLQKQEDGVVTASEHDTAGNELAGHINRQNNKVPALAGVSFNRR